MNKSVIHSVLEVVAANSSGRPAVRAREGQVTYGELNAAANRLALYLTERQGVRPGEVVATFLSPGINYVIGLLGIMKAGGVFLPMEPAMPARRQEKFLSKAAPSLVIGDAAHEAGWSALISDTGASAPFIRLEDLPDAGDSDDPPLRVSGDDGCYVVFTSGSTGEPKAILGSQKGLSHFVHWEVREFGLDSSVRVSQLAPPTFDVSLRDVFVPLLAGGTLCIPPAEVRADARRLLDWLDEEQVTLVHCVPSIFRELLRELSERVRPEALLPALRHVLLAGEPLYGTDVRRWRELMGERVELVNLYGPSETTLAKAFHRIRELPREPGRMIPVGHPLPNTALLIIKDGELCDPGEIGELYVKTPFMSKGYYGDPELTAEVFVQNPLTHGTSDIVYRTGDLGRYWPDRSVELLGRQDGQVKVKGVRVETSEVEQVLLRHPAVEQAVVIAHTSSDHQVHLTAYFISPETISDAELRRHLLQWLPAPMCPSFFVRMERFPLSLHGKVLRRALPRPADLLYQQRPYLPPEGELETALAELWGEVLELQKVSAGHSFVELGGDSLKAIRLLSRTFKHFGVDVRLQELYPRGTVRHLASLLEERLAISAGVAGATPATLSPHAQEEVGFAAE